MDPLFHMAALTGTEQWLLLKHYLTVGVSSAAPYTHVLPTWLL